MKILWIMGILFTMTSCTSSQLANKYYVQTNDVQLSAPVVLVDSTFFFQGARLKVNGSFDDGVLLYNRKNPEESNWKEITRKELIIQESGRYCFKEKYNDFKESSEVEIDLVKVTTKKEIGIITEREADPPYNKGTHSKLQDLIKAELNFHDEGWFGYNGGVIDFVIENDQNRDLSSVYISFLEDMSSWIFMPDNIRVFDAKGECAFLSFDVNDANDGKSGRIINIDLNQCICNKDFTIRIQALVNIPEWHPGHGKQAWVFIDEIIVE